ncbi:hypothetical protein [Risungbinella massiliensis]|uniref:hypothetical protein n=1 Tax=Risungbinella massiliensis TaxID=1329796 RepID=UPI0005CC6374|nr:hypothetical protein [Risungbinella massiliensis]
MLEIHGLIKFIRKISFAKDSKGKKIWQGKDKKLKLTNLKPNQQVNLTLSSYDENDKLLNQTRIKAVTKLGEAELKELEKDNKKAQKDPNKNSTNITLTLGNANARALINEDTIKLEWSDLPDEDKVYEIYRDDKKYTTVSGLSFTDTKVEKGKLMID